jgi:uncharacterized SAM-binding protein YcdF (DUF218 family)
MARNMGALRLARTGALVLAGAVLASEAAHWRASKRYLPPRKRAGPAALIVLGYHAKVDGSPHPVQKWRAELAARAWARLGAQCVVFSGGDPKGGPPEAEVMATCAERLGVPKDAIVREQRASNTKENIAFSLPLVSRYDTLAIVSDPLHAARARRYLWQKSPSAARKLVSAGEYRFLERWWLKLFSAAYELYLALAGKR